MRVKIIALLLACSSLGACVSGPGYYEDDGYYADRGYEDRGYSDECRECGRVERIEWVRGGNPQTSGGGAILGALVGGALGSTVGRGDGRRAATVGGAVIGGVIGNEVEKDDRRHGRAEIIVRMENGERVVFDGSPDELREGDDVIIVAGELRLR